MKSLNLLSSRLSRQQLRRIGGLLRNQVARVHRFYKDKRRPGSFEASFLEPIDVPGFVLLESIGRSRHSESRNNIQTPISKHKLRVDGVGAHEIWLTQRPFVVGYATINRAWVWAKKEPIEPSTMFNDGLFQRYTGKHFIVSLDGYTYSDCLYRSHSLPDDIEVLGPDTLLIPRSPSEDVEHLSGEYILLGDVHNHFGHTLVESLSRFWYLEHMSEAQRRRSKFVFFSTWGSLTNSLLPQFLSLYGIDTDQIMIIDKDIIFEKLTIPSPAQRPFMGHDLYYSRTMERTYETLSNRYLASVRPTIDVAPRIYLSRSQFTAARPGQRLLKESEDIEALFETADYKVVYPEKLPFAEQLALARRVERLAGPGGSAQHIAAFAQNLQQQTILTSQHFLLGEVDFSLVMMKNSKPLLHHYLGRSDSADPSLGIEADWSIVWPSFKPWFEQIVSGNSE